MLIRDCWRHRPHIDGSMQERRNSIANALELRLYCTNPSIWRHPKHMYIFPGQRDEGCSPVRGCVQLVALGNSDRPEGPCGPRRVIRLYRPSIHEHDRQTSGKCSLEGGKYRQVSNVRRTLVGNWIADHSDVVGASPVGAAPTTSSFSTWHLASKYCIAQGQLEGETISI